MNNYWGKKSLDNFMGIHPSMVVVCTTALHFLDDDKVDVMLFDGVRTESEQEQNITSGVSWTMESDHIPKRFIHEEHSFMYATAVDVVPYIDGKLDWRSERAFMAFKTIGKRMRQAAKHHRIQHEWGAHKRYGGDWSKRNDMAHHALKGLETEHVQKTIHV